MASPTRIAGPACAPGAPLRLRFDGRTIDGVEGDSICSALHAAGERVLMRSIKYHRPRGYACGTGKCASCLVRVDGTPNVRACVAPARDGMVVETQNAFPSARRDFFAVVDKVYRSNFDYHERFIRPKFMAPLYNAVIRRMAGFGKLPEGLRPLKRERPAILKRVVDVLVVGAGPAGLAAAAAAAEGAASVLVVDESPLAGGSLLLHRDINGEDGTVTAAALLARLQEAGGELLTSSVAFGCYLTDGVGERMPAPGVIAVLTPERIIEVRARALVVASGYHETPALFPGNDLPGVMGARAALLLLHRHGVLAGQRVALASPSARKAGEDLAKHGAEVVAWGDVAIVQAEGGTRVERVRLADGKTLDVDAVLYAGDETPRVELLQQCGVPLVGAAWSLVPDITRSPAGVFAAGEVLGASSPWEALASGEAAGEAAAAFARGQPS